MDDNKNKYYVYIHRRNDTNDVFYVGKGNGRRANSKHRRSDWWNSIVAKAGGFTVEFAEKEMSEESAFDLEIELIKFYRENGYTLCNHTDGGEGPSGMVHTEEAKAKIALAHKGNKYNVGRKHSDEIREKLSKSKKGRNKGQTHNRGRKHSDESKKNMSIAQKNSPQAQSLKKPVLCSNGMLFGSIADAVSWLRDNGKTAAVDTNIIKCCKGRNKTAYGFTWKYYIELDKAA